MAKLAERKTIRGVVRAKCPKCERWKPLDGENFYTHDGEAEPYLGHCKDCERKRSSAWHRERRAKSKAKRPRKR